MISLYKSTFESVSQPFFKSNVRFVVLLDEDCCKIAQDNGLILDASNTSAFLYKRSMHDVCSSDIIVYRSKAYSLTLKF